MIEKIEICPFCRCIPRVGQNPSLVPCTPFDQILFEGSEVVLVPAKGMLVPGYFLLISKEHLYSYSSFCPTSLENLDTIIKMIMNHLTPVFGEYLIFEHGSSKYIQSKTHGASIIHAHFHLFPIAQKVGPTIMKSLKWESIPSLSALSIYEKTTYALVGNRSEYFVAKSPNLTSQWVRKVIVETLGLSSHWDWANYFGDREFEETILSLRKAQINFEKEN